MSEQTANLCTTDACESLRARLAKYDDAEGNPISIMAEQAREIASKQATINGMNEAHWKVVQELAALKAQPSGVDERAAFEAAVCERYGYTGGSIISRRVGDYYADASLSQAWALWQARAALTASAPMPDPARQYIESEKLCDSCGESEICCRPLLRDAKQSLTASAPNHSEQVREGWQLVPVEPTPAMLDVAVSFALNVSLSGEYNWSSYMRDVWLRMLAAAPSAGSQGGDV